MLAAVCVLLSMASVRPALAESLPAAAPVIFLNGQPAESVVMNLSEGSQLQFASDRPVQWTSNKPYRAAIDANGLLTGRSAGSVIVTAAAADGKKAACEVRMTYLVTGISISGPNELAAGKRGQLKAAVLPANAKDRKVVWTSSDESVVAVSSSGRITAKDVSGVRSAVITAAAKDGSGVFAQHTVTVMPAAKSVSILSDSQPVKEIFLDISKGNPIAQLSAVIAPSEASQAVTWKSSAAKCVSIDETGRITGLKTGTATITATAADGTGRKATVKVRVVRMVTGIEIQGGDSVLSGKKLTLDETVYPKNATTRAVTWESSDPSVATVDKYGKVTAKQVSSRRSVTITARAKDGSGVFAQHTLTVTPRISGIRIMREGAPADSRMYVDMSNPVVDLSALVEPADARQDVKWSVSSASRARVDANGRVTGLKTGSVTVTAKAQDGSGKKATVKIEFVRMVRGITITGDSEMAAGKSKTYKIVFEPASPTNKNVTWESSDPDVLSINRYGNAKAAKVTARRTVTVYAKANDGSGVVGSKTITVTPRASSVTICRDGEAVENIGLDLSGSQVVQLTAKVGPEDAGQAVKWTTSAKSRATVDQNGLVRGLKSGKVTITATAQDGTGVKAKVTINIGMMVKNIAVSGPTQVSAGRGIKLTASAAPSGATKKGVVWSSANEAVAKVNQYGTVIGCPVDVPTQVTIYATAEDGGGAVGEYTVTVLPVARGISISRADAGMASALILSENGGAARLSASVYPAAAQQQVSWSSSNRNVVTVDADGVVRAQNRGRTTIYAKANDGSGVTAVLWVAVVDPHAAPYYFEVDEANQVVRVYERGADNTYSKLIKRMICSTGNQRLSDGLHSMNGERMVYMTSVVDSYALYATRIEGHFMFHSTTYTKKAMDKLDRTAYEQLGSKVSRGCIRLLAGDSKWIHDNASRGCIVNIIPGVRDVKEYGAVSVPALKGGKWDPTNPHPDNPDFDPTYTSDVK